MFMAQNPDMPKYVQNDLYNSRIAYPMDRQVHPEKIRPGDSVPVYTSSIQSESNLGPIRLEK
jgi:hypothetical protein